MKNRLYKKIKSMLINQFGDLEKAETEINKYGIRGEIIRVNRLGRDWSVL